MGTWAKLKWNHPHSCERCRRVAWCVRYGVLLVLVLVLGPRCAAMYSVQIQIRMLGCGDT